MPNEIYPRINIRSKNDLAKRISNKKLKTKDSLRLINDVLKNFDKYWHDSKASEPEKEKYIRSAAGNNLGNLLDLINKKVLAPHDQTLPYFIFGGISDRNHVLAAVNLLGNRRDRVFYKLDLKHFFEQIPQESVFCFFLKCGCSKRASILLSKLCCVPEGKKWTKGTKPVLARGFSTSPRLAVWCNLDTFQKLKWRVGKILKNYDFKISVYVDDIGISASRVDTETITKALNLSKKIIEAGNLKLNEKKTILPKSFSDTVEYLGLKLGRNKVYLGKATQSKLDRTIKARQKIGCTKETKESLKGLKVYRKYVNSINNSKTII